MSPDPSLNSRPRTLFDLARTRARLQPDAVGFTYLTDGETQEQNLTYGNLDTQARALAARLQQTCRPGDRVLLLYDSSLDYIAAFLGCVYAGTIPVPAYPPDPLRAKRTLARVRAIAADCQPALVLGTDENLRWAAPLLAGHEGLNATLATDAWTAWSELPWTPPDVSPEQIAFLQYTSGSTGAPHGVMVSHGNLMHQLEYVRHHDWDGVVAVSWLPLYHDLGLIGGVFAPLYFHRRVILMSPFHFVQQPLRWLWAMSRYRGTTTGGPNFAFELCVNKFRPREADGLDLSNWRIAMTGAEPVRAETLERFTTTFAPFGLRSDVWFPCYGLAEATLGVTGEPHLGTRWSDARFSAHDLEQNRAALARTPAEPARRLVACGRAPEGSEVVIADPHTFDELPLGRVGEVWVRGPSIAQGYWNRPDETTATFHARLADGGRGPFLRTGDLGFFHDGQLYLAGRLKDLLIFAGRNLYPQDIEQTVSASHPALKADGGAAFALECDGQERLVVVQEVVRPAKYDLDALATAVRQAIEGEHQVPLHALVLIKPGTLPKTSSGKVQRGGTRQRFLDRQLDEVRQWVFEPAAAPPIPPGEQPELPGAPEIRDWLRRRIAQRCNVPEDQIRVEEPLHRYVLDSLTLTSLAVELQQWLSRSISPLVLHGSPSLVQLAERLADPRSYLTGSEYRPGTVENMSEKELDQALAQLLAEAAPHSGEPLREPSLRPPEPIPVETTTRS